MFAILLEIFLFVLLYFLFVEREKKTDTSFLSFDQTDFMRGMAILMIIVMHSCANIGGATGFSSLGGIGVALFLILSGYGLNESNKKNGIGGFWSKKLSRILLPYSFFIVVVTIAKQNWDRFQTVDFLLDLLCINTSYWFVSFLVYNYVLFWISKHFNLRLWPFLIFGIIIFLFFNRLRGEQVLSFPTGILISEYKHMLQAYVRHNTRKIIFLAGLLLSVSLLMFVSIKEVNIEYNWGVNLLCLYKYLVAFSVMAIIIITPPPVVKIYEVLFKNIAGTLFGPFYIVYSHTRQQ